MTAVEDVYNRVLSQMSEYEIADIEMWFYLDATGNFDSGEAIDAIVDYVGTLLPGENIVAADIILVLLEVEDLDSVLALQFSRKDVDIWEDSDDYNTDIEKIFKSEQATTGPDNVEIAAY